MDVPEMRAEAMGLGGGAVRVQLSSPEMMMNVDLDRDSAIRHAARILYLAGAGSVTIMRDGSFVALPAPSRT